MADFVSSGEFTTLGRIKSSLKINLMFYFIAGIIFGAFMVYLYVEGTFETVPLKGFFIALSNAFGLFLIMIFLGYGLVSIPKKYFKMTSIENRMEHAQKKIEKFEEELENSKMTLEDVICNVFTL